ncbi:MAG: hypothetical protein PHF35_03160 [Candidatus Moranbacteria bacterium]|nr:hypothetical protein [Candidatus Moranbacteria bacterium]
MKFNVLVVESDPVQTAWAKEQLTNSNLETRRYNSIEVYYASCIEEVEQIKERVIIDFVLQNLEIPHPPGGHPHSWEGRVLFKNFSKDCNKIGGIRGLALMLDFGRCALFLDGDDQDSSFGGFCNSFKSQLGKISFEGPGHINAIIWQNVDFKHYPFYLVKGQIIPNEEKPYNADLENCVPLKPWKEILDALIFFENA